MIPRPKEQTNYTFGGSIPANGVGDGNSLSLRTDSIAGVVEGSGAGAGAGVADSIDGGGVRPAAADCGARCSGYGDMIWSRMCGYFRAAYFLSCER